MKPFERANRSPSRPVPQVGQARGSVPSSRGGKSWSAIASSTLSITSAVRRPLACSAAAWNASQKRASSAFHSMRSSETSSRPFSRSDV